VRLQLELSKEWVVVGKGAGFDKPAFERALSAPSKKHVVGSEI
jgi:hypothetical protein